MGTTSLRDSGGPPFRGGGGGGPGQFFPGGGIPILQVLTFGTGGGVARWGPPPQPLGNFFRNSFLFCLFSFWGGRGDGAFRGKTLAFIVRNFVFSSGFWGGGTTKAPRRDCFSLFSRGEGRGAEGGWGNNFGGHGSHPPGKRKKKKKTPLIIANSSGVVGDPKAPPM